MSADDFDKLCPIYHNAMAKMAAKYDLANTVAEKVKLLEEFSENYLMLPEYWRRKSFLDTPKDNWSKQKEKARSHLYSPCYGNIPYFPVMSKRDQLLRLNCHDKHFAWKQPLNSFLQSYDLFETAVKRFVDALSFPNRFLKINYETYEYFGAKPVTKNFQKKYEKLLRLSKEFKEAETNDEKWFKCMNELEDDYLIKISNIEYRLGFELKCSNKDIWRYYIEYLRHCNPKGMLDIYRRYNRLFISDKNTREEYRKEIERIGKLPEAVTEFWNEQILFELHFGTLESAQLLLQRALTAVMGKPYKIRKRKTREEFLEVLEKFKDEMKKKESNIKTTAELPYLTILNHEKIMCSQQTMKPQKKLKIYFSDNFFHQNFCLPQPIIRSILNNSKHQLLQKLYFSCKYFYAKRRIPLCHRLIIDDTETRYFQHSLLLSSQSNFDFKKIKNLHVTQNLTFGSPKNIVINRKLLSQMLSKFYKCEAKYVEIFNQDLTLKDFQFLFSSGKAEKVKLCNTRIFRENSNVCIPFKEVRNMMLALNNNIVEITDK